MKVGDKEIITYRWQWHECQECGYPASWRITFLFNNARGNPASSAYQHDDCSWCSDNETFACKKHQKMIEGDVPDNMRWCASFPLKNFKHMGFYRVKIN